ncbi:MAG: aldehyde dehydrogenase family protein, partial [Planctomycetota bacterium]
MKPALLLVDLQRDFLRRPGLHPRPPILRAAAQRLLEACRARGLPVHHLHTHDAGEPVLPPAAGERVWAKKRYRGDVDYGHADTLIVAGLYLHACVREAVLDAHERGLRVWIADDAVGTTEPDHAELVRIWMETRVATFLDSDAIVRRLDGLPDEQAVEIRDLEAEPFDASAWADRIEARADEFARTIHEEIGKPLPLARAEVGFAVALAHEAARLVPEQGEGWRQRAHGTLAVITPFNNPLALPVGRLAPALHVGNAVVWKPAPQAPRVAQLVEETLDRPQSMHRIDGDAAVARRIVDDPRIGAVAFTGSTAVGRALGVRCARRGIPLQAELGGNNAAILLADADLGQARAWAQAAFGFAGQRCTAIRRFIVEESIRAPFEQALVDAARALDREAEVGPVISEEQVAWLLELLADCDVAVGGTARGRWMEPTVVRNGLTDRETFGPIALIQPATDLEEALALANGVEHGLAVALPGASRKL